jgi:hypothetical protein
MRTITVLFVTLMILSFVSPIGMGVASAEVITFENDLEGWQAAAGTVGSQTTIDFDDVSPALLDGNEFHSLPAGPIFSSVFAVDGVGPFVSSHNEALSPANVLRPTNSSSLNDGVVRVTFDAPIYALGASFSDVEGDFAETGFGIGQNTSTPDVAFTSQASDAWQFHGFVSDTPFTVVDVYMAAVPGDSLGIDGVFIDDLRYSTVPEPSGLLLLSLLGTTGVACGRRRFGKLVSCRELANKRLNQRHLSHQVNSSQ